MADRLDLGVRLKARAGQADRRSLRGHGVGQVGVHVADVPNTKSVSYADLPIFLLKRIGQGLWELLKLLKLTFTTFSVLRELEYK